jgi:hypothetical protein
MRRAGAGRQRNIAEVLADADDVGPGGKATAAEPVVYIFFPPQHAVYRPHALVRAMSRGVQWAALRFAGVGPSGHTDVGLQQPALRACSKNRWPHAWRCLRAGPRKSKVRWPLKVSVPDHSSHLLQFARGLAACCLAPQRDSGLVCSGIYGAASTWSIFLSE